MLHGAARVRSLRVRAVNVPMTRPHATAGGTLHSAPLALIDLTTDEGLVGRSYLFTYTPTALRSVVALLEDVAALLIGADVAPSTIRDSLQARFRLLGAQGIVQMVIGGIDMALWDALSVSVGLPLCRLLGGSPRSLETYWSFGMMSPEDGAIEAERAVAAGFRAVKFKLGGENVRADRAFVGAVRSAVGDDIGLMVDYNQSLTAAEAVRRGRGLEEFDLMWLEEPCRMDDDAGHAVVAAALDTPVVLGENWWSPAETARAISARALDEAMLDVMKIGGVSGWMAAAGIAAAARMRVSSHLFTEFSAQLVAASPSGRYVEWLDLVSPILRDPLMPRGGAIELDGRPGAGLQWDEAAIERYAV